MSSLLLSLSDPLTDRTISSSSEFMLIFLRDSVFACNLGEFYSRRPLWLYCSYFLLLSNKVFTLYLTASFGFFKEESDTSRSLI